MKNSEIIEIKILNNVYKDMMQDGEPVEVLVKRDVITKKIVDIRDISSVQETLNMQGKPYKNKCMIHIQNEGHCIIKHKYEEIKKLKENGEQRGRIGY